MSSCINRLDDELDDQQWKEMVLKWNGFKFKVIDELNEVKIKNKYDTKEVEEWKFLFNNKSKILANRELINLLKNWE